MPLQPGEVFIGSWEPYIVEPRFFDYVDHLRIYTSDTGFQYVFTDPITPRQIPEFKTAYGIEPNPFPGQYDRYDYEEAIYQRQIYYFYSFSRANGTSGEGYIEAFSYSRTPQTIPVAQPLPTLRGLDSTLAQILHDNSNSLPSLITSINWLSIPALQTITYNLPLFLPGWVVSSNGIRSKIEERISYSYDPSYPGQAPFHHNEIISIVPTRINFYKKADKPTYYDLSRGYPLDTRVIPNSPQIIVPTDKSVTIGYYRENKLEPIPDLRSLDWLTYKCDIPANTDYVLPIVDCVLGTLEVSDSDVANAIDSLPTPASEYPFKYYFGSNLAQLFAGWYALWNPTNAVAALDANGNGVLETRILRTLGGNNDHWNNRPNGTPDLNVDPSHPLFVIDTVRSFDWHLAPQSEGIGILIMDSPRIIEAHAYVLELRQAFQAQDYQVEDLTATPPLHYLDWYIKNSGGTKLEKIYKALGAEVWGTNPDDPNLDRVDDLGWRIKRLSDVLGIRVKTDGKIDEVLEKTVNRRLHSDGLEVNDVQDYNPNCFGKKGMLVRHVPNKFGKKGTVSGGYRKIHDLPQLLAEMHEQANAAMGYQEGTAIEIQLDGKTYRYPNQLALITELFVTTKQIATYSKGSFFSSVIAEQSIKEVISGLGLRTVDKYLEFIVAGKPAKLYYKGVSASQSIRRKLSAIATNVGTVLGNII